MKFDVFISFRGIDTGKSFVSHLFHALYKHEMRVFKENKEFLENKRASPEALQAIEESKVAVVVISVNYSSSVACLDEFLKILVYEEKQLLVVVPVFYDVDPYAFESGAKELAKKLGDHVERYDLDKGSRRCDWKAALIQLTHTFRSYALGTEEDSDMIDKIVNYISPRLIASKGIESRMIVDSGRVRRRVFKWFGAALSFDRLKFNRRDMGDKEDEDSIEPERRLWSSAYEHLTLRRTSLVWMDMNTKFMNAYLEMKLKREHRIQSLIFDEDAKVREVGMWGEAGVGKTTLSRYIYEEISPKFQDHYYYDFMNDAPEPCLIRNPTCLLEEIARAILTQPISSSFLARCSDVVKAKLGHRKVLLIVDGVDKTDQLKYLIKISHWFGPGSRLILVANDKNFLLRHGITNLYEVESLKYDDALQLFSQYAFKQRYILRGFEQLCVRAVLISGRLPLALKVLGSYLCGKSIKEWEFELLRLEATQANSPAIVSSFIGGDFYGRKPTKLDQHYIVGKDEGNSNEFPS